MNDTEWKIKPFIEINGEMVDIETLPPKTQKAIYQAISDRAMRVISELKLKQDIEIVKEYTSLSLAVKANQIYRELIKYEDEFFAQIAFIYHLGIMEGKRQDRARRKKVGDAA